jgi:hypothetical protein
LEVPEGERAGQPEAVVGADSGETGKRHPASSGRPPVPQLPGLRVVYTAVLLPGVWQVAPLEPAGQPGAGTDRAAAGAGGGEGAADGDVRLS